MIIKKSPEEIEKMAGAGAILAATLDLIDGAIRPGITTKELVAYAVISISCKKQ